MRQAQKEITEELHRIPRKNFLRRKVIIRSIDETWQADWVEMQPYSRINKGYKYLLTVIDNFSKYAWVVPVKTKSGPNVTAAFKSILDKGRKPQKLHTDRGLEFYNENFQRLLKQNNIKHYSTYSNMKASIVERFNRTLKSTMWKYFSAASTYKWTDKLQDFVDSYNNTIHRTIKMKPKDVTNKTDLSKVFEIKKVLKSRPPKFKVGDYVRINKYKHVFEKGYTTNWSAEVFEVTDVLRTFNPTVYKIKDYNNDPIAGTFY